MTTFNPNFYSPNTKYTKEIAEQRLKKLGYSNFSFTGLSYTNGASFYFTSEDGKTLRVSDHKLTGSRAFNTIQIDIVELKKFTPIKKEVNSDFMDRINAAIAAKSKQNKRNQ